VGPPSYTVLYDANVLYPAPLRDLLMRLAMEDISVLAESSRAVAAVRPVALTDGCDPHRNPLPNPGLADWSQAAPHRKGNVSETIGLPKRK
jgi:hypothetical protein